MVYDVGHMVRHKTYRICLIGCAFCPIITHEHDERVFELADRVNIVDDLADIVVQTLLRFETKPGTSMGT